jgi:hypothetical protein
MATALAMTAMIGGSALSTYSAIQGGKEAAGAGKLQQQQLAAEANAAITAGGEEARLKRQEGNRLLASQIAAISASGSGLVGSNLVVMAESARNVEMDALTIERNAQVRASSLLAQGAMARYEGQLARRNARIKAFSNILGTAGQLYMMYKYPQTSTNYSNIGMSTTKSGAPYLSNEQLPVSLR